MCILILVMMELEVGVGRMGKDDGKKSSVCCSLPGGCFFGCVVPISKVSIPRPIVDCILFLLIIWVLLNLVISTLLHFPTVM